MIFLVHYSLCYENQLLYWNSFNGLNVLVVSHFIKQIPQITWHHFCPCFVSILLSYPAFIWLF